MIHPNEQLKPLAEKLARINGHLYISLEQAAVCGFDEPLSVFVIQISVNVWNYEDENVAYVNGTEEDLEELVDWLKDREIRVTTGEDFERCINCSLALGGIHVPCSRHRA